ncbi:hypothetical protein MRX96_049342 [Rhipicephalus microplus]
MPPPQRTEIATGRRTQGAVSTRKIHDAYATKAARTSEGIGSRRASAAYTQLDGAEVRDRLMRRQSSSSRVRPANERRDPRGEEAKERAREENGRRKM